MADGRCRISDVGPRGVRVRMHESISEAADPQVDAAWRELTAANPRLYDGPVLLVDRVEGSVIHARAGRFRMLATAALLGREVRSLGVQGVVIGRDHTGETHVLFGRRSGETRIYGGLWENAPSGSLTPPRDPSSDLDLADFAQALATEGIEELGIDLTNADLRVRGLLDDPHARSLDVVLEAALRGVINPRGSVCAIDDNRRWEYVDTAWVRVNDIRTWSNRRESVLSPPTAALMQWLGWC